MKPLWEVTLLHVPHVGSSVEERFEVRSKNGSTALRMAKRRSTVRPGGTLVATVQELCKSTAN